MLSPDNRQLFLNALKPPDGYQFDRGIGTTFTLDLITLLITPLSLTLFDQASVDEALKDPLILLEGLRRNSDRLTIFCQAGYISIPPKDNFLYRYLEDMIVEVNAPGGGVFHPKFWLLRYISEDKPILYRCLNLSRNLTFDRSWDLMLQLDGEVADRKIGYWKNKPISDFIRTLPDLALREPNHRIKTDIDLLNEEVRRVNFKPPYGFDDYLKFYPSGIPGYRSYRFSDYYSRLMVISPFLSNSFINQITKKGSDHILISKISSIDDISVYARNHFKNLFVLDDLADRDPEDSTQSEINEDNKDFSNQGNIELTGLHAKLIVMENGWNVRWLLGSANATDAAFKGHNVEFMVELIGKKSRLGIENILGSQDDDSSLNALLKPYPSSIQPKDHNINDFKAEELSNEVRNWLVKKEFELEVRDTNESLFDLLLETNREEQSPIGKYSIICWPITLSSTSALILNTQQAPISAVFTNLSPVGITPFIAFQVNTFVEQSKHQSRFVLNLPIKNLPHNRDDLLITAIIDNQGQFLRYLRILLSGDASFVNEEELISGLFPQQRQESGWEDMELPLLEVLIRALSRSPETKIDRISEIVEQLQRTTQGQKIIPAEFNNLWQLILQARKEIR